MAGRQRVIIDNDFSGDPDGLLQLVHHLLSPSVEIRALIGSHLRPGDPFDPSESSADYAWGRIHAVLTALGVDAPAPVVAGSNSPLPDMRTPLRSAAATAIVAEALADDPRPLFLCCGAGLTEVASAWLMEPRISERLTLVWIGGPEDPDLADPPPHASPVEYNLNIDVAAARVVLNESDIPVWQVPRNAYRQVLVSTAELDTLVRPQGDIGRLLADSLDQVHAMAGAHGLPLGETYIWGDSPLVLLTALQSSFEADPSSSEYRVRPCPTIAEDGTATFGGGRPIRVYTRLDTRLLLGDFFAKLARHAATARQPDQAGDGQTARVTAPR